MRMIISPIQYMSLTNIVSDNHAFNSKVIENAEDSYLMSIFYTRFQTLQDYKIPAVILLSLIYNSYQLFRVIILIF